MGTDAAADTGLDTEPVAHPLGPWRTTHTVLHLDLAADRVVTAAELHLEPVDGVPPGPLVLDGRGLETIEVSVDGRMLAPSEYELDERTLRIDLPPVPTVVRTRVSAVPGVPNDKGFVFGHGLLSTNLEPQGFRRITWFLDRPANRSTFDVTLVADRERFPVLRCNGDPAGSGVHDDGRHWARFVDPVPKPSYLFAVVAGDLVARSTTHTTRSGRQVTLTVMAPPSMIAGADFALWIGPVAMAFDEANGGIEHDLDELVFVAVPGYPDATEYHGLMFFEPGLLVADPRGHVDDDLMLVLLNVAHEYGHHVRGNRVTVRTWGELALKEGLTVLTGQNDVRAHVFGPAARVIDVLDLRRLQFPEELTIGAPVVRGEVDDPTSLYTRTTYLKGAEIFGMLRTLLGADRWRTVLTEFTARHDLDAAGVGDFLTVAREVAPELADDVDAIGRWFTTRGRPALTVDRDADGITIRRTDALTDDPPLAMPVVLGFLDAAGRPTAVGLDGGAPASQHTVVLRAREQRWAISAPVDVSTGTPVDPVVSPLRGYSAPVDLEVTAPAEQLAVLVEHDSDPYARWWAAQELMIRSIDAARAGRSDDADAVLAVLVAALGRAVPTITDPVLLAQVLAVPDEHALGDRDEVIDVDGVARGLADLRVRLGRELHDVLIDTWHRFDVDDPAGCAPSDLAARMLVEPLLALLLAGGSADGEQLALAALRSENATRAVRAFGQLAHVDHVPFDELAAETFERWRDAPKLVDRWLRAQSGARRADTIERVAALAAGPLYDRDDRARVMAVWFPFATRNRSVFHHPSGEGYRVFVDELGDLMPRNAGVAVRLVGDLLQFRRFDPARRALMRAQMERMLTMEGMPDFATGILRHLLADA